MICTECGVPVTRGCSQRRSRSLGGCTSSQLWIWTAICSGSSTTSLRRNAKKERFAEGAERREGLEAPPGFEPGVEVLQTSALPLGDGASRRALKTTSGPRWAAPPAARWPPHATTRAIELAGRVYGHERSEAKRRPRGAEWAM